MVVHNFFVATLGEKVRSVLDGVYLKKVAPFWKATFQRRFCRKNKDFSIQAIRCPMSDLSNRFEKSLLSLDRLAATRLVMEAAHQLSPLEIVDQIVVKALTRIGESWERGDAALSQVYMSGRICEDLVDQLLPPGDPQRKGQPTMAIAVLDDHHVLGKRIVYSVLRAEGFELKDFGCVSVDEVVEKVCTDRVRFLLLSTLMLHSALRVREVVAKLKQEKEDVKIVVGGAPFLFDCELWREVKADAMGRSASDAPGIIRNLMRDHA